MKISGDYTIDAPRELVWQALLDPDVLARTLPGCEELEKVGENKYEGKLKMKIGPVQGVFEGGVELGDLDPLNGYTMKIEGKGPPGFMNGNGNLRLADDEGGTKLSYEIDAQVGGRIASIGQRLVESSAKVITKQGLKGLDKQIQSLKESVEELAAESPSTGMTKEEAAAVVAAIDASEAPTRADAHALPRIEEHGAGRPVTAEPQGEGHLVPTPRHQGKGLPIGVALILLTIAVVFVYLRGCTG